MHRHCVSQKLANIVLRIPPSLKNIASETTFVTFRENHKMPIRVLMDPSSDLVACGGRRGCTFIESGLIIGGKEGKRKEGYCPFSCDAELPSQCDCRSRVDNAKAMKRGCWTI